jgi:hypothetical protein
VRADGTIAFERGALDAAFAVTATPNGTFHMRLDAAATALAFADITVRVTRAPLKPLYDALLGIFHGQIAKRIEAGMRAALVGPAPAAINRLLATVPSKVRPYFTSECFGRCKRAEKEVVASAQAGMRAAIVGPAPAAVHRLLATVPSKVRYESVLCSRK